MIGFTPLGGWRAHLNLHPAAPDSITYQARVVFSDSSLTYHLASDTIFRDGNWHDAAITDFPEPTDAFPDEFGIVEGDEIDVTISGDYKHLMDEDIDGNTCTFEILSILNRSDGSTLTQGYLRTFTIQGASAEVGEITLSLVSLENTKLDQVYPATRYTVDDYSEIFEEHVGRPIPKTIGLGIKIPCALISTGGGSGPWVFAICETGPSAVKATGSDDGVLAVYRNNRVVDTSEYTVSTDTSGTKDVLTVEFTKEPVDFQGNFYTIHADVRDTSTVSRNVATEIERLLGEAGVSVDSGSITSAESYATDESMLIDYVYGRDGERTFKAHLEDLLFIARGGLKRESDGSYYLFQDREGSNAHRYDEDVGDPVEISDYRRPPRPTSVSISYKPSIRDTSNLRHTITRSVTNGTLGDEKPRDLPQLMDHTAAGKLCDYLSKRAQYNRTVQIYTARDQLQPTHLIGASNDNLFSAEKLFQVRSASMVPAGSSVEALEYNPAVYSTSAGTPPSDATTGYQTDFSSTPPDAPTSLSVDSSGVVEDSQGNFTAYAVCTATPPAANFNKLVFQATENGSGAIITTQDGEELSGGDWQAKLGGLPTNKAHTIFSYAVNEFDLKGATASTSHTTSTDAGAPSAPSAPTLEQIPVSRMLRAYITDAAPSDFSHMEWQSEANGSGVWTDIDGERNGRIEFDGSYSSSYKVRARFVDKDGNASSWSTASSSVSVSGNVGASSSDYVSGSVDNPAIGSEAVQTGNVKPLNITTGKIADDDVTSSKRQGVSSSSVNVAPGLEGIDQDSIGISFSKGSQPIAIVEVDYDGYISCIRTLGTSSITVNTHNPYDGTKPLRTVTVFYW